MVKTIARNGFALEQRLRAGTFPALTLGLLRLRGARPSEHMLQAARAADVPAFAALLE